MTKPRCMELGVLNSAGSLVPSAAVECRFCFQSAFDFFCIASEAFYELLLRRRFFFLTQSTAIALFS
ncbi:hypothetical protein ACFX12_040995 [Malus domestica]